MRLFLLYTARIHRPTHTYHRKTKQTSDGRTIVTNFFETLSLFCMYLIALSSRLTQILSWSNWAKTTKTAFAKTHSRHTEWIGEITNNSDQELAVRPDVNYSLVTHVSGCCCRYSHSDAFSSRLLIANQIDVIPSQCQVQILLSRRDHRGGSTSDRLHTIYLCSIAAKCVEQSEHYCIVQPPRNECTKRIVCILCRNASEWVEKEKCLRTVLNLVSLWNYCDSIVTNY